VKLLNIKLTHFNFKILLKIRFHWLGVMAGWVKEKKKQKWHF